ncbi:hypothetical protein PTKIN_Ptkin04bG0105800 [Pterospermum kingtungense]
MSLHAQEPEKDNHRQRKSLTMMTTTLLCFTSPISKQPFSPPSPHKPIIPQKARPLTII